ncbi:MAG TPA: NAD(+)--rifampin ADP-ribosyltransferase [Propionibacteriaceae bacterium]|nr:NAD(+)--rifampin ADP-ribosyltransferase [Propionibacteriaceae bacterium]
MYYTVPPQGGRRYIVTGANSGTGREVARRLAGAGAEVVLAVRSLEKGEEAKAAIQREAPDATLDVRHLDLADISSVRDFAAGIVADGRPVQALVNNAGVMIPPRRFETADGFELQFGTNFLGPYALTVLMLPVLVRTPGARVATMSSGVANVGRIAFDDLNWTRRRYISGLAYAQSKLADLLMGRHLAQVATDKGWDLLSTIAHPGYTRTNLQTAGRNLGRPASRQLRPARRTFLPSQAVETGAEPLLFAATSPEAEQGAYYGPSRWAVVGPTHRANIPRSAQSLEVAGRLWDVAERLVEAVPDRGPFFHGTKVALQPGETLAPGFSSNFGSGATANFVYLTGTLDAAIWGAELAAGDGPGRVYRVEPTGNFENDPNLTNVRFPGNATRSYRSRQPLRVVAEVTDWTGHDPAVLQRMRDSVADAASRGIEAIND